MYIYLPIAEISVNAALIIGLGWITGTLSGLFGIGGGFLLTPLLMFIGVTPAVAVATAANQIIASSVSGFMTQWRRDLVDFKMGGYLLLGGWLGSTLGVAIFRWLKRGGNIDVVISISYVLFLGIIGSIMAAESLRVIMKAQRKNTSEKDAQRWWDKLPMQHHFPKSNITLSMLMPIGNGFFIGILVSLMGVGGGFFLIPAMIYILRMPTSVVIGTSLFQIIFISANVTLLHAITTHTVDVLLAFMLLLGGIIGAQTGARWGAKLPAEYLRALLSLLVLAIATNLAFGLFTPPKNLFTIDVVDD